MCSGVGLGGGVFPQTELGLELEEVFVLVRVGGGVCPNHSH